MLSWTISRDRALASLPSDQARLLYTWLLPHADNLGRMDGEPDAIRATVIPRLKHLPQWSPKLVETYLRQLDNAGLVILYDADGLRCLAFPADSWNKHQRIVGNMKRESDFPAPPASCANEVCTPYIHGSNGVPPEVEVEVEVEKEEKTCAERSANGAAAPPVAVIELPTNRTGIERPVTPGELAEWTKLFPGVDVNQSLRAMRAWLLANPTKRKTARGMSAFVVRWLTREQDAPRENGNGKSHVEHATIRPPQDEPRFPEPHEKPSAEQVREYVRGVAEMIGGGKT